MNLTPSSDPIYQRLAALFPADQTFVRQGFTYITGEGVVSRLNEVLGFDGWSFSVLEHGMNTEADEIWVLGELRATLTGWETTIVRQQYGSQKVKRPRGGGAPLDIGFDFKGATTDALKKCASLIGVGLYLSHKESGASDEAAPGERDARAGGAGGHAQSGTGALVCAECAAPLETVKFQDGTVWTPAELARHARGKHGRVLCMGHYRAAHQAQQAMGDRDRREPGGERAVAQEMPANGAG